MAVTISSAGKTITLRKLTARQLKRLDMLLEDLGSFGSVKLIVKNGTVTFVEITTSKRL